MKRVSEKCGRWGVHTNNTSTKESSWNITVLANCFREEEQERERRQMAKTCDNGEKRTQMVREDSKTTFAFLSISRVLICRLSKPRSLRLPSLVWVSDCCATCFLPSTSTVASRLYPNVPLHPTIYIDYFKYRSAKHRTWLHYHSLDSDSIFLLMQMKMNLVFCEATTHSWIILSL